MLESALESKAVKQAKRRGWAAKKIGTNGYPDHIFWQRRVHIWVEFKIWPNRPTPLQQKQIDRLKEQDELVHVSFTIEDFIEFIDKHSWWRNDYVDTGGL